jgi:hypothetical protein
MASPQTQNGDYYPVTGGINIRCPCGHIHFVQDKNLTGDILGVFHFKNPIYCRDEGGMIFSQTLAWI